MTRNFMLSNLPPGVTDAMIEDQTNGDTLVDDCSMIVEECEQLRAALERAVSAMNSATVFIKSRERLTQTEGENWWDDEIFAAQQALERLYESQEKFCNCPPNCQGPDHTQNLCRAESPEIGHLDD